VLVESGRCPQHTRAREHRRGSASRRHYDRRHRQQRLLILARDPICRGCGRAPSTVDDHIVPITAGGSKSDSLNQQGLCTDCHGWKTVREQRDPFLGIRLRAAGQLVGEPAPYGWRHDPQFTGVT
jgi:5-methylcytosine-specific restriction protein A